MAPWHPVHPEGIPLALHLSLPLKQVHIENQQECSVFYSLHLSYPFVCLFVHVTHCVRLVD